MDAIHIFCFHVRLFSYFLDGIIAVAVYIQNIFLLLVNVYYFDVLCAQCIQKQTKKTRPQLKKIVRMQKENEVSMLVQWYMHAHILLLYLL